MIFLIFAFGFMLGLSFGMVAGMSQKDEDLFNEK